MKVSLLRILLVMTALAALAGAALAQGFSGALWTTDNVGTVDKNVYNAKDDVYVNGGPHGGGNGALPQNATFYIRVLSPGGDLLGTSVGSTLTKQYLGDCNSTNDRPVATNGTGNFCHVYHLDEVVEQVDVDGVTLTGALGFRDTSNAGGEYKVEIADNPDFNNAKSDNFKVLPQDTRPQQSALEIKKFYDSNANGVQDPGEPEIKNQLVPPTNGWKMHITYVSAGVTIDEDFTTSATYLVDDNTQYTVYEYNSIIGTWFASTAVSVTATLAPGGTTVKFGNYARGAVTGGLTIGFWSNKNGSAILNANLPGSMNNLTALNLCSGNGSAFDPAATSTGVKNYQTWLLNATATNMAYMLSAQLSAMQNNVSYNGLSTGTIIFVPSTDTTQAGAPIGQTLFNNGANITATAGGWYITVGDLMTAANSALGSTGGNLTNTAGALRTYEDCLKTLIDQMNNNGSFGGIGVILPPIPLFGFAP